MTELEHALATILEGKYSEADDLLSKLIDQHGFNHEALGHRAYLRLSTGRYEEAKKDYQLLIENQPLQCSDPEAFLAKATLRSGDEKAAIKLATEILLKDPSCMIATEVIFEAQKALGYSSGSSEEKPVEALGKPINPVLDILEKDKGSAFPTSILPEVSRFIYTLVRATKPKVAIETGTFIGYSSISIAQALEDQKQGHLHCFDIFQEGFQGYTSPIVGKPKDFQQIATGHIEQSGVAHRITLHKGDSSATIKKVFPEEKPIIDFAFIDGDHTIKGCLKDWDAVDARLAEGALVVLHDTNPEGCHWLGPRFLMENMEKRQADQYRWINIQTLEGIGLGVIQKKNLKDRRTWKPSFSEQVIDKFYHELKWDPRSKK